MSDIDTSGPFPAILGKGPWLELGKYAAFWDFFISVKKVKKNAYKNVHDLFMCI